MFRTLEHIEYWMKPVLSFIRMTAIYSPPSRAADSRKNSRTIAEFFESFAAAADTLLLLWLSETSWAESSSKLAERFWKFFWEKINHIRCELSAAITTSYVITHSNIDANLHSV